VMRGSVLRAAARLVDVAAATGAALGLVLGAMALAERPAAGADVRVEAAGAVRRAAGRADGVREVVTGVDRLAESVDSVIDTDDCKCANSSMNSLPAPLWFIDCNVFRALVFPKTGPFN